MFVVNEYTGKCEFQDHTKHINSKYARVIGIILAVVVFMAILLFIKY